MTDPNSIDPALDRIAEVVGTLRNLARNEGLPRLDFIDVKIVLDDGRAPQRAHFGAGEAAGPGRATKAAEAALRDLRRNIAAEAASERAARGC